MKRLDERGSSVVEMSLVLPVFLLIVVGSMTVLWLITARTAITGAVDAGGRFASIGEPDPADVREYVRDRAGAFGGTDLVVGVVTDPDDGRVVTVTARRSLPNALKPLAGVFGVDDVVYSSDGFGRDE